jgi:hypothetical protein
MNNPDERYDKHLKAFQIALVAAIEDHQKRPLQPLGQLLYAKDGRTPMFQLQGLARLEKKMGRNSKVADEWLAHAKELEDALGKYDYWVSMLENNRLWRFTAPIEQHFRAQVAYSLGVLEERLMKLGWVERDLQGTRKADDGMRWFHKTLKKADWRNPSKERKKLLAMFRDEAMEVHDKVIKGELDLDHVELGIHEFRRNTRWLGIYASALLGKVRLDKKNPKGRLGHYITPERVAFKHNQLPDHPVEDPVLFLPGAFYAMSELIAGIGDIKDPGLATEEMMHLGKLHGISPGLVRKHLGKDLYPHAKVVKDAKSLIMHYVAKERIFLHMADHFDAQLK